MRDVRGEAERRTVPLAIQLWRFHIVGYVIQVCGTLVKLQVYGEEEERSFELNRLVNKRRETHY